MGKYGGRPAPNFSTYQHKTTTDVVRRKEDLAKAKALCKDAISELDFSDVTASSDCIIRAA